MLVSKMKIFVTFLFTALLLSTTTTVQAAGDSKTVKVKTPTIQCGMCVKTIEKSLKKLDGVFSSKVDLKKKVAKVKYNPEETNPKEIRNNISKAGYQADKVLANKIAYEKLHGCCKLPEDQKKKECK